MNKPQIGELYKHFKGNIYYVIDIAEHVETGETFVVYADIMYDKTWIRELGEWNKSVELSSGETVPRFVFEPDIE